MKKNILIAILALVVLVLAGVTLYQSERLSAAKAYINDLEADYPDYLDTTSEVMHTQNGITNSFLTLDIINFEPYGA